MIISNGKVFDVNEGFIKADIVTAEKRIVSVGTNAAASNAEEVIDAEGLYVIPGLTDVHFHGCVGHDFCEGDEEGLNLMAEYELKQGVTTICPASMTFGEDKLTQIFENARKHDNSHGAELVGINMEGPFISYEKKGAQNPEFIHKPDADMFFRLQEAAGGLIKLCDIAPEVEGAMECIDKIADAVHVSIAHTMSDYETAMTAFGKGADHVTHLYNAMPPFHHRKPGVVGAAADCEKVYVELIGDGVHSEPATVRTTLKMYGEDRLVLISDSMEACGMPDGEYELGGQPVTVRGNLATLHDGTIAGSATNLMDCVRVVVKKMNIPLATAVKCAAVNSAKSIGIYDNYGSLEEGKVANIVLLDDDLNIKYVIRDGVVAYKF